MRFLDAQAAAGRRYGRMDCAAPRRPRASGVAACGAPASGRAAFSDAAAAGLPPRRADPRGCDAVCAEPHRHAFLACPRRGLSRRPSFCLWRALARPSLVERLPRRPCGVAQWDRAGRLRHRDFSAARSIATSPLSCPIWQGCRSSPPSRLEPCLICSPTASRRTTAARRT